MDILISVAAKIAELTVQPIGRQVEYLLCYKNNLKELKHQLEELQTTKERIDHEVEAEGRNGREIQGDVLRWQESVIKTLGEVEKLCEDEPHASVQCWKWSFPNFKSRHQLGRKAKKMANTVVEIKEKGNFDKGVGYARHLDIINNFSVTRGSDELKSRNSVKEDIVLSLKDPKVSKIGVYGIGGVGKTTLVQEVAKQVKHDKLFDTVVMVTISQTNLERIQDEIAERLGLRLEERTSSSGRANCLCERIKKEKTILIILDDLREKIELDKLGIPSLDSWGKMNPEKVGVPLKDDCMGCKLLLTSRGQDILQKNDTQKNFSLQVLNDEESWSLFEAMVGDVVKDHKFRKIATQVAQRCVGLPVLIVTTAKSLKYNKDIYYWKDTLNNLIRVDNSRGINETLSSALEFNFNRLEDEVKKVFLLCGVLGTSILVSDLLKYAIGLGIFKCINAIEDARNRLYRIIIDLKASCLLADDDARAEMIKMHDIVHEVAVSMASKYVFTKSNAKLQDWPRKDILERCTHIILLYCCIQKLPERLDCPHLTFLYINSIDNRTLGIPDSFFEGMGNLEALDLTGMIIASLPISFSSLTKLKTLCLDHCSLKDMTRIGALVNLEILSLIHSSMEEFPREIGQLTKLRMLDLSRSGIGTTLPNILCKLTKIEELYMGDATINWGVESSTTQKRNSSLAKLGHLTSLTTLEIQIREAGLLPKDIPFEKLERYKVVIGDKWEWSYNKETSRLLKVKLDTNIRWERGIKTLIKRVEDLYLDKISGISNVLFELNGEGFPLLKHLHIQNNAEIQHIVNSMESNQTHVLFAELETLILHNVNNLVKICHGPVRDNSFGKLKVIKVKSCDQLVYLFSVSTVKAFSQLVEIKVSECSYMKKIVSVESADSGKTIDEKIEFLPLRSLTLQHLPTIDYFCSPELTSSLGTMENLLRANISTPFFSAKVKFSNLETLKLSSVNLKKIWDESSASYLVHNLANFTVEECSGLKYLFSSSVVGRLSNLKQLEISKCDMMEEIIATEEINGVAVGEVLFPKLEAIIITDMLNLKTIWHLILASNSLACLKTLKVKTCEKIEKIFPEYMNGAFATLETLMVEDCKSVQEIFQLGVNADDITQLKYITLLRLPQLKQVWSRRSQSSLHFKNLQVVRVEDCGDLEYLFPFSVAGHLPQLEAITIKNAENMKEIVSKREELLDNLVNFEFNQLTSVVLWNLQDLQGFYAGNHSLSCSSLKELNVWKCGKLKLFKTQGISSQERHSDDNLSVSMQQPLFTLEEVIDNLEELSLNNEDASMTIQSQVPRDQFPKLNFLLLYELEDAQATSPYWFLQNISSLEWLVIRDNSFKVIFPNERPQDENGKVEIKTRLKKLTLFRLFELQHICKEGCQLDPVLDVLEYLDVDSCSNLKHLVPSSVTFNHLTYLEVGNCNGLIYIITSSTARSLVKLTTLKIRECDLVEGIVAKKGGESKDEIEFNSLKVLELESLPKLSVFGSSNCSLKLPLLENLVIRQCPRMKTFSTSGTSTPLLREILTDEQDAKWFCEGDLNSTVNKIFQHMVAFRSMERLELSQYPELRELWYSHIESRVFGNLKNLVVHKCDFLSKVFLPLNLLKALSNLEELEVSECDSLEALIELPNMNEERIMEKVTIHLQSINLSRLPKLKHIWSFENFGGISSENNQGFHGSKIQGFRETTQEGDTEQVLFPKLLHVHVENCNNLEYLFPLSIAMHVVHLEDITIKNAAMMKQIVSEKEGILDDNPVKFEFNHLTSLALWNLNEMEGFFAGSHSLLCPLLRKLDIRTCAKVKLFKTQCWSSQGRVSMQQPLFTIDKVICKLEQLTLNSEDADVIMQGQLSSEHFIKLKCLILTTFNDDHANFPCWFLQKLTNLEHLVVEWSSFKEIFHGVLPADEKGKFEMRSRVKSLLLNHLHDLQHLCKEGFQMDPILENLEILWVQHCSNMKHLVPSSVTFCQLTYLEVQNCIGLTDLVTLLTARSLVKLTTLKVRDCGALTHVVVKGREEAEDEITFRSLQTLELQFLPKIECFCSTKCFLNFPLLEKVVVEQCPRMDIFTTSSTSTPKLQKILSKEEDERLYWDGDLNRTINKMFVDMVAFRSLEHLELSQYPEFKDVWYNHDVQPGVFGNLKTLAVKDCDFLSDVLLPLNLLQGLPNLEGVDVSECDSLEAVFDLTHANEKENIHLKTITLSRLPGLKHIWKQNSHQIMSFDNSQGFHISKIQGTSETTKEDKGDLQHQQQPSSIGLVLLPKLETIIIEDMENLETIWHPVLTPNSMGSFKRLKVKNCQKIQHIFPIYMHGVYATLETLKVKDCNSVQEIFQLGFYEMRSGDDTTLHKNITLLRLPKLKQIWSRDPQSSLRFKNLQVVRVEDCDDLEYLFPFSIAMNLPLLEQITIKRAKKIKEIVSKREEPLDNPVKFEFKSLTSLVLWNLRDLEGFYAGNHNLACHSLKELDFFRCMKLKLFNTHSVSSQGRPCNGNLQVSMQQPLFTLEEVMGSLEQLALSSEHVSIILQGHFTGEHFKKLKVLTLQEIVDDQTTFPYWFLQNMTSLEHLIVGWSSFKETFPEKVPLNLEGKIENTTRIKKLTLRELQELHHICKEGCQIDPILEVLEHLDVDECSKLKHLVPSSLTFNHLTYLEVQKCKGLIYLITSSTARSLVKLTTLKIRECDSAEEIVAEKGEDSINVIAFNSLEVLELDSLSKLQMFCSSNSLLKLPLLEKLVIRQCPRMTSFSTGETSAPMLRKILTDEQDGIWCWEGDLNRIVNKMFQDKVAFSSFNHLEFSEYPELKELWYGQVGHKIFCNLKHLVVRKCIYLSNVIFSSNLLQLLYTLEELEVAECDSLEVVFDVKALDDKSIESKEVSRLKKLTLSELPNLKRIWNREAGEIISFGNLQIVKVDNCLHLKYLFPISLCQDLRQLEELHIKSCGVEEIVSIEEGLEEFKFEFPRLTSLELFNLMQLTNFCPKRYTLECPSLKTLNVRGYKELQIFAFDHLNIQLLRECDIDLHIKQALFYIEKVSQNLEELSLNEKDAMRILNGNYEKNLFQSIKILRLHHFQETPIKFLNDLIQKFPAITTLQAGCSSFRTLFPLEEIGHCSIESPAQIETLLLFQLEKLEHIWNDDDSASHPLVQNLEYLYIWECSGIRRLAPPSASFKNLTYLDVQDCNGLMYFMTSYTAKSLVHLTSLRASNCGMLEEIVMMDEGESEEEIIFESLKYLEIICLSSFKSFCSGKQTFMFPSLVTLKVIGCHKMQNFSSGVIIAPFLKLVEVEKGKKRWKKDLNMTIKQLFIDKEIGGVEGDYKESSGFNKQSSQTHQKSASTSRALSSKEYGAESKANEIVDSVKQEILKLPIPHTGIDAQKICKIAETPLDQASQNTFSLAKFDAEMNETIQTPLAEAVESKLTWTLVQETAIDPLLSQALEDVTSSIQDEALDGSQDLQLHPSESLLVQTTTSIMNHDKENTRTKEMNGTIQRPLVQNVEEMLIPASSVQDIAPGIHVTHESIDKPFVQATQDAWDITIVHEKEELHDSDIHLSKNLFNQTTTSMAADYKETVGTQEKCESKRRFSVHNVQNVLSPTMIYDTANDPAPSQASKGPSSSTTPIAGVCSSYKELDISMWLLPYLEAGVKQHPQVLNWLNTNQRRVFASSSFSLFAEVTQILRTTRRVDLTEDDRNYIRKCCAVLQGAGFDDGWISYVHGCTEECEDGEDLERKVEEAINKKLASLEESLVLLRDKASKLHGYICLSTLINALLSTILFFIIIYVYQKNN